MSYIIQRGSTFIHPTGLVDLVCIDSEGHELYIVPRGFWLFAADRLAAAAYDLQRVQ